MASIYIIKNNINDKVYIGQTILPINIRFTNHKMASRVEDTKFYRAIRKYGENNFYIELLETTTIENLNSREKYWINYYDSYKNGYNSTLGGDGVIKLDYELIYSEWLKGKTIIQISKDNKIDRGAISRILKNEFHISEEEINERKQENMHSLSNDFILQQWNNGLTPNQIVKQYGSSINTVKKVLYKFNLTDEDFKQRMIENQRLSKSKDVLQLWNSGLNISEISKVGGNWHTIKKILLENGVTEDDILQRKKQTCNKTAKPVVQLSMDNKYIETFSSSAAAGRSIGKPSTSISSCCNHKPKYKTAYGFKWMFLDEYMKSGDKK